MQIYILALIPVAFPFLVALAIHLYNMLLIHLPKQTQTMLLSVAHTAVLAAEQSGAQGVIKKHLAEDTVHTILSSFGLKIDPVYIDAAIEATVHALHNSAIVIPPIVVPPVEVLTNAPLMPPIRPVVVPQMPTE